MATTPAQKRAARYAAMDDARLLTWLNAFDIAVASPEPQLSDQDRRADRANLRAARREALTRRLVGDVRLAGLQLDDWIIDPGCGSPAMLVGFGQTFWPYKTRLLALRDAGGRMYAIHVRATARVALAGWAAPATAR